MPTSLDGTPPGLLDRMPGSADVFAFPLAVVGRLGRSPAKRDSVTMPNAPWRDPLPYAGQPRWSASPYRRARRDGERDDSEAAAATSRAIDHLDEARYLSLYTWSIRAAAGAP